MTPLRIGILGCANIARVFARDLQPSALVRVDAVASRNAATAAAFAAAHRIPRQHASYEALLADRDIDALYIPLPNSLHAAWAIKAAEAGKHVLCEKPLALGLAEAQSMFAAARAHGVMLLEAFPYYFQPQTGAMLAVLREGAIGSVRYVHASIGFTVMNPANNIRMAPDLGGGALLDAGSYPLSLIRLVMGRPPTHVRAEATWAPTGVDISMTATLNYAGGERAHLECAMDVANHRRALIAGTAGTLETEYLNHVSAEPRGNAFGHLPSQLRLRRGVPNTVPFEEIRSPGGSGFRFAAEAFATVVAARDFEAIELAAEASLDNAATLEALAASARQRREVEVQDWRR